MFGILKIGKLGASMKKAWFNPRTLFAASEPGAWYDPSDLSTLFQDSAGSTPVTAVEQPVGRILDKSGRGNHATQSTTTKRPVLKIDAGGCYYLSFDGVDDALQTGNIDFTGTDKMTVWTYVESAQTGLGVIAETSATVSTNPNSFLLAVRDSGLFDSFYASGATGQAITKKEFSVTTRLLTASADLSVPTTSMRLGGSSAGFASTSSATSASGFGNYPLYIGARAGTSLYFNGRLYGLIVRGAQSTLSQIEATELYMKKKVGIA